MHVSQPENSKKHAEKPLRQTRMSLKEMQVYHTILADARRQLSNLLCVVIQPADDQLEEMMKDADNLKRDVTKFEERLKQL